MTLSRKLVIRQAYETFQGQIIIGNIENDTCLTVRCSGISHKLHQNDVPRLRNKNSALLTFSLCNWLGNPKGFDDFIVANLFLVDHNFRFTSYCICELSYLGVVCVVTDRVFKDGYFSWHGILDSKKI